MSMIIASTHTSELLDIRDARLLLGNFQRAWSQLGILAICRNGEIPPGMCKEDALQYALERAFPTKTKFQDVTSQGRKGVIALDVHGDSGGTNDWGLEAKGKILNGFVFDDAGGLVPMFDDPLTEKDHRAAKVTGLYHQAVGKLRAHGQGRMWTNIMERSGALQINPSVYVVSGEPLVMACAEAQRQARELNLKTSLRVIPVKPDEDSTMTFLEDIIREIKTTHDDLEARLAGATKVKSVTENVLQDRIRLKNNSERLLSSLGRSIEDLKAVVGENDEAGMDALMATWGV